MSKAKEIEKRERKHFNYSAENYEKKYGYDKAFTKYKINKKANQLVGEVRSLYGKRRIKILEIGCGTGAYTKEYSKELPNASILAIDISGEIIKIAKRKSINSGNVHFKTSSAYATKLKDESVDVICGFYVLHHLDMKNVIKETGRILKPGGLVYFYEPNILNPVVYAIKSNRKLKSLAGDSSDEWAINPLRIGGAWKGYDKKDIKITEFVWPLDIIPLNLNVKLDKYSQSLLSKIPIVRYIGGSVKMSLVKK